jgi:hypothetical protein
MLFMARTKTTIYLEPEVLRAMRVAAARAGKRDSDVVEEALRRYLGLSLLDQVWAKSDLDEEEALQLAYEELEAVRAESAERA